MPSQPASQRCSAGECRCRSTVGSWSRNLHGAFAASSQWSRSSFPEAADRMFVSRWAAALFVYLALVSQGAAIDWIVPIPARGTPVVDDNAVYFVTRSRDVVAVARHSGRILWKRAVTGPRTNLAIAGDFLLVGDFEITALSRQSGEVRWVFSSSQAYGLGVYLGDVRGPHVFCGSASGQLIALNWQDGSVAWSTRIGDPETTTVFPPREDNGRVLAGYSVFRSQVAGGIVSLSETNGEINWKSPFPKHSASSYHGWAGGPAIVGGRLFAADGTGAVTVFAADTGAVVAALKPVLAPGSEDFRAMVSCDRAVVVGSTSGVVVAYSGETTQELWRMADTGRGTVGFSLSCAGSTVAVPFAGSLALVDTRTGKIEWDEVVENFGNSSPPAIDRDWVFTVAPRGLIAFRFRPGRKQ